MALQVRRLAAQGLSWWVVGATVGCAGQAPTARAPVTTHEVASGDAAAHEHDEGTVALVEGVTVTRLVDDVWLHTSVRDVPPWGPVPTTGLLVEREADSLLVDTAWDDAQTQVVVRWAREVLGKPVVAAVFTHAHADKMGGVGALRDAGVETWAPADSNALAGERGLTPAARALSFDDAAESHALPPLVVFDPGGGHTTDNVVVAWPARGVIFGGCLVRPPGATDLGNVADADVDHWDAAVAAVAARFPDAPHVVPSHGPPAGRELLDETIRLVRAAR